VGYVDNEAFIWVSMTMEKGRFSEGIVDDGGA
jgi:hypothetical protein